MCFSPTASFVASAALTVVGVATLRETKQRAEFPFALIPLMFAAQQLCEGILWLTFSSGDVAVREYATYAFTGFSRFLWPIYVPLAVYFLEPVLRRKKILLGFVIVGTIVGTYLLYFIIQGRMTAEIIGHHIVYVSPHLNPFATMIAYVAATCVSSLFSTYRGVQIYGLLSIIGFAGAYIISEVAAFSVW
ncbi:MAG: hypothetical protein H7326_05060, partial [Bdellovibrionaceae bacterium]|nr:hypothetical protein [Pseudobdellovibrionaceae bacterium]